MITHTLRTLTLLLVLISSLAPSFAATARPSSGKVLVTFLEGTTKAQRQDAAREMGLKVTEDIDNLQLSVATMREGVTIQDLSSSLNPMIMTIEEDVYRNWLVTSAVEEEPATETRLRDALNDLSLLKKMADIPLATVARKPPEQARIPWGIARVNAPAAWPTGQGEGIKVAVIDTGIDCFHPDLQCDFSAGINILDPDLAAMDDNEHGSHVSGTIAGRGIPGGVLGVAPKAELIAVKVLNQHGSGHLSGIIKGIHWAARVGVQVINLSLGSPINSPALERAVMRALSAGVVVVAAAGNSGPTQNTIGFPAGYPGVIAVAASDENDHIARFSSRGPAVGFAAPGVEILSTVPGGGYAKLSGTSMACPHVSGLAALAIERGALGPDGVRQKFSSAATKLCRETHCRPTAEQGEGIIDAARLK